MAERTVRIVTKRTAVPGKIPTGTTGTELNLIKTGELASNLADKKLYSFDGSEVFEFGTNSFLYLTGGTVSGNVFIGGDLSASTLNISNTPTNNDSATQILARNSTTGIVEYRNASTLSVDTFVTGGTFSAETLTLNRNDGNNVVVTGFTSQPTLNNGEIFVGDTGNTAQSVAMTGDVNINNAGITTIQNGVVTYAKMQTTSQPALLGSTSSGGTIQEIQTIEAYIGSGSTAASLLDDANNWSIYGVYTGTTISGTFMGQSHYNDNYWYTAIQDNIWIRLIRG